jgi:hypothetical protein
MSVMDPFRPGGPVRAAATWLHHVKINHDLESAWPLTHRDYRRFLIDAWLSNFGEREGLEDRDRAEIRDCLIEAVQPCDRLPDRTVWHQFCVMTLAALDELWSTVVWEHSGWGTEPRVLEEGHEIVVLFDKATEEPITLDGPAYLRGFSFELKGEDGDWLMANVVANESEDPDRTWRPKDPDWLPQKPG